MKNKIVKIIPLLAILCGFSTAAMADGASEPIPSFYQEPGISNNRDYVNQHANERIDPFTGKLQWHFVDVFLPGNGGLDLKVQRSYTSPSEFGLPDFSPVGLGWTMHFGRVLRNAATAICDLNQGLHLNPVWEAPNGARSILYIGLDNASWITTSLWRAGCSNNVMHITSPDGTRYEMGFAGVATGTESNPVATYYVTQVTDRNGNWIKFTYQNFTGSLRHATLVTSAEASDGRELTFTYSGQSLATIRDGGVGSGTVGGLPGGNRVWTYTQETLSSNVYYNLLKEVSLPNGDSWRFDYNESSNRVSTPGGLAMRRITYPGGGSIDYTYKYLQFAQNPAIPVSEVVTRKDATPGGSWGYVYKPATQPIVFNQYGSITYSMPPSAAEAKTLDQTTVYGPEDTKTYYHVGYNSASSGLTYLIGTQLGSESPLQLETFSHDFMRISNQINIRPGGTLVWDGATHIPLLNMSAISRAGEVYMTRYENFDGAGNPQMITETGTDTRTTNVTYNVNTAKWILHQKKNETVSNGTETLAVTRQFDSDGNMLNETRAGVPTDFTYGSDGTLASRTDARNKTTYYSDYYRGIPRTEIQPEGVTITRTVDNAGNVWSQRDGESATVNFTYDALNRVTGITHPLGNPVVVAWSNLTSPSTRTVTRGSYRQVTKFDGFGREISVQHTDTATNENIIQNYQVDTLGRRIFASYPNSTVGTRFVYDMLGRVKYELHKSAPVSDPIAIGNDPNVVPQYTYGDFQPSATDIANTFRTYWYDSYQVIATDENQIDQGKKFRAYGSPDTAELIGIFMPIDTSFITGIPSIAITRNIAGQMKSVVQDGVTRAYDYDTRFFLTSMTEPEYGITLMGRDEVGNMTSRKVGTSGETTYSYDDRNRLKTITYPLGTPGVTKTYYKDDKVKSIDNGVAKRDYVYDANKNLKSETLTVGGKVFSTLYDYNGNDAHTAMTYGSNRKVSYAPDAFGRPRQASPYVSAVAYHPSGQASGFTYANGVQTSIGLSDRQWPSTLQITKGSNLFNTTYGYDPAGNVKTITDSVDSSYNRSMGYDGVNRLTSITSSLGGGSISYDLRGNITYQNQPNFYMSYNYNSSTQRLVSAVGSKSYTLAYDTYGNVTNNGTTTFAYNDAANMKCAKCGQAGEILFDYDGANQRVRVQKNGVETYFVYGSGGQLLWEETPNSLLKEYIYLGGKQVAVREQVLP